MYSYQFLFTVFSVNSISRINFVVAIGEKVKKKKKKNTKKRDLEELFSEKHFTQQDLPRCFLALLPKALSQTNGQAKR